MKAMKKWMSLLLAGLMVLALCACGGSGGSGSGLTTAEKGKLHMATNAEFPPFEMVTDGGGYAGIDVEVAGKIAEKLGLELVVDDMDFDAALLAVQSGQCDVAIAAISVRPDRAEVMDFSNNYYHGVQAIIVKEGSDIQSADDLSKAELIGTQRGTTGYDACAEDYGEDHVVSFDNGATAVQALLSGQVDCVVIDDGPAKSYVAANQGLVLLDSTYAPEDYAVAMRKGNTDLVEAVNKAISELQADGTFQSIVDKYITGE